MSLPWIQLIIDVVRASQVQLQSWSNVLGTPCVNLWRNFLSVVTNTRLPYLSRIPWRHAPSPHTMLSEYLGNVSPNIIFKWGHGILALAIEDVKFVTLVRLCPNNFVQDCSWSQSTSETKLLLTSYYLRLTQYWTLAKAKLYSLVLELVYIWDIW